MASITGYRVDPRGPRAAPPPRAPSAPPPPVGRTVPKCGGLPDLPPIAGTRSRDQVKHYNVAYPKKNIRLLGRQILHFFIFLTPEAPALALEFAMKSLHHVLAVAAS